VVPQIPSTRPFLARAADACLLVKKRGVRKCADGIRRTTDFTDHTDRPIAGRRSHKHEEDDCVTAAVDTKCNGNGAFGNDNVGPAMVDLEIFRDGRYADLPNDFDYSSGAY
jgi:hypothetical protein